MQPHVLTASVGERSEDTLLDTSSIIVPVDGIKATIVQVDGFLPIAEHPELEFETKYKERSGQVRFSEAKLRGLTFTIYPSGRIELTGSLHRYANNGLHNADDFTLESLRQALQDLVFRFGIALELSSLHNLEGGFNIRQFLYSVGIILDSLVMYSKKRVTDMNIKDGHGRQVKYDQYALKFYDKGLQYPEFNGTFRVEVKYVRSEQFAKGGIRTLADLLKPSCLLWLANQVRPAWEKTTVVDAALLDRLHEFSPADAQSIRNWREPRYWEKLRKDCKSGKCGKNRATDEFNLKLEPFIGQHSTLKIDVAEAISVKCRGLEALNRGTELETGKMTAYAGSCEKPMANPETGKMTGYANTSTEGRNGKNDTIHKQSDLPFIPSRGREMPSYQSEAIRAARPTIEFDPDQYCLSRLERIELMQRGLSSLTREQLHDALGIDPNAPF